ncbi:carotenoid oxygenase [Corallococcus praedator]|uniref:Carotenoid oxygenase n=1 Tax=Corallococcus praedator TaxID=2316724 RepID=A0ABX9Q9M5_9BACT|nr:MULTISPECIES: carotenoid oxygenase family protein [Corallococcus]RKH22272.1 carotenoid oxygenase [Corallococcus sp. CA031C]RKH95172.1 carotenoid oxygenase [Corallococcus praedator]
MTTATSQPAAPPLPAWSRAFRNISRQHGFQPLRVEGRIPEGLRGSLFRLGAWTFDVHGLPLQHWFDGDGGVMGVRFGPDGVQGAARLVDSRTMVAERKAGRQLFGSYAMPTPLRNKLLNPQKNNANTALLPWNGKLYALHEPNLPVELSTEDLTSLGETNLDGVVLKSFSAHPHRVASRATTYNFGQHHGRVNTLELYALPDGGKARHMGSVTLPGATMVHDYRVTDRYLIFFLPAMRIDVLKMLLRIGAFASNVSFRPGAASEVLVVPIDDVAHPIRIPADSFFNWHFSNAYEDGDTLVVDYVRYPDFASNPWLGDLVRGNPSTDADGMLHRAVIDLKARTFRSEQLMDLSCEFPRVAPSVECRPYQTAYLGAHSTREARRGLYDTVVRLDLHTGRVTRAALEAGQYPSEPVFVPRPGSKAEDDGWLLTQVFDTKTDTTHVAVLDAERLDAGPVARCHFEHALPPTFHGAFIPA